jgi:hypothetical protein
MRRGVTQIAQSEPGFRAPVGCAGLLPMAGRASGSTGTSMVNWRRNLPSPSNTSIRALPRSATYTFPSSIKSDIVRRVELPVLVARLSPRLHPVPRLVDLCNSRIDVSVADVRRSDRHNLVIPRFRYSAPSIDGESRMILAMSCRLEKGRRAAAL